MTRHRPSCGLRADHGGGAFAQRTPRSKKWSSRPRPCRWLDVDGSDASERAGALRRISTLQRMDADAKRFAVPDRQRRREPADALWRWEMTTEESGTKASSAGTPISKPSTGDGPIGQSPSGECFEGIGERLWVRQKRRVTRRQLDRGYSEHRRDNLA